MGNIRQAILDVLQGVGIQCAGGGFWTDEQGNLIEDYAEDQPWQHEAAAEIDDAWQDEQGNPLLNYIGEDGAETEERHHGSEQEEYKDAVSAGHVRDTAQRGGA